MTPEELMDYAFERVSASPHAQGRGLPFTVEQIHAWLETLSEEDLVKVVVFSAYKQVQEGSRSYESDTE